MTPLQFLRKLTTYAEQLFRRTMLDEYLFTDEKIIVQTILTDLIDLFK